MKRLECTILGSISIICGQGLRCHRGDADSSVVENPDTEFKILCGM